MNEKLGIVTINFNTEDLLERLIQSLLAQTFDNWVMVIVNNSESDTTIKKVIGKYDKDRIRLLSINKNIGYSRGNNAGFEYLYDNVLINDDERVLFTNEDIVIDNSRFLEESLRRFKETGSSFWGPKVINTDGSLMMPHLKKSNYLKCLLHLGNNGTMDRILGIGKNVKKINHPFEVFLINGAFFICNAADFIKVDKLDENTFIYYEEELLYRKVADNGLKVIYDPTLSVLHEHSASVKKSFSVLNKKRFVYDGELYFLKKILKVNKMLEYMFRFERNLEFALFKVLYRIKRK